MGINTILGQKIAAKILQKSSIRNKELDEKVRREIRFSKYFRHPNIIHLYEVIETPNEIIMIMEYAQGGELFDLICRDNVSIIKLKIYYIDSRRRSATYFPANNIRSRVFAYTSSISS